MKLNLLIVAIILSLITFIKSISYLKKLNKNYEISDLIMIGLINTIILLLPVFGVFKLENKIELFLLMYLVVILIEKLFKPYRVKNTKLLYPIMLFLFFCFLSIFFAFDKSASINLFFKSISYCSFVFIILHLYKDYNSKLLIIESIKLSSFFLIFTGFYQLISGISNIGLYQIYNPNTNNLRISMTFNDSLEAAVFTTIIIMVLMCDLLNSKKRKASKVIDVILIIILLFLIIKTGARTTIISLAVSFFVFYILVNSFIINKMKFYMKIILISPLVLVVVYFVIQNLLQTNLIQRFNSSGESVAVRTQFWNGAIEMFRHNIYGVGLGNFKYHALNYIDRHIAIFMFNGMPFVTTHAENTYLTLLAETGLGGALCYIYLLISTLLKGIKNFLNNKQTGNKNIFPMLIVTTLIVIIINNVTTYFNTSQAYMSLFWIIIALLNDTSCGEKISED